MTFTVPEDSVAALVADYKRIVSVLSRQPGFIRARLHRGLQDKSVFFN